MNKIIFGLVIFAIGLWATVSWWWFIKDLIKGVIAILLLIIGLTLVGIGVKNTALEKTEKPEQVGPTPETK